MPDCSPEVLQWSMAHASIIKLSDEELPQVFSMLNEHQAPNSPQAAAHTLLEDFPGCQLVAMTLGAHGSLLTTRESTFGHPGFPVKVVDTVGAGDAFTAGLVHAYLRGASLRQMAEIGNLCGSYVASQPGATPPLSPELIDRIGSSL
jgi:fructokinase